MTRVSEIIDAVPREQIVPLYQKLDRTPGKSVTAQICKLAPLMIFEISIDREKRDALSLCYDVIYFFGVLAEQKPISHLSVSDQAKYAEMKTRFIDFPFNETQAEYRVRYQYDKSKIPSFLIQQFEDAVGTKFLDALTNDTKADLSPIEKEYGVVLTSIDTPDRKENRKPSPPRPPINNATHQTQSQVSDDAVLLSDIDRRTNNRSSAFLIGKPLEQTSLRLLTDNPPRSVVEQAHLQKINAYFLTFFCVVAALVTLIIGALNVYWMIVPLAATVGFGVWSHETFRKSHECEQKWETSYHTIVYNPPLKGGKNAIVEIQLEIPVGWSTPETLSRLEHCAKPSLYELFSGLDTVPLRSQVFECIERQLVMKQRELALGICRMQLLKNFDPAMPPFGTTQIYRTFDTLVTYEIADLWRVDAVNRKISDILISHPDELVKHAEALNIRFIDIQKRSATNSAEKYSDW